MSSALLRPILVRAASLGAVLIIVLALMVLTLGATPVPGVGLDTCGATSERDQDDSQKDFCVHRKTAGHGFSCDI